MSVIMRLPVFLPGNNRNWDKFEGKAEINEEGEIKITLKPEDAVRLVDLATRGVLFQCSFDYRMSAEMVEEINAHHKGT